MFKMGIFFILMVFFRFNLSVGENEIKIKGLRCNISEQYFNKNYSCYPKVYSRTVRTAFINITALQPLNNVHLLAKLFYKYGVIYREVMHTPMIDWCKVIKEGSPNPMIQQLFSLLKDSAPDILQKCPLNSFTAWNFTVNTQSIIPIYATGDYKLMFLMFDKEINILSVNIIGEMNSTNKDTFG